MTASIVFISYSQDSDEHKDRVLQLADRLRDDGIDANIDQYQVAPKEGWVLWMEKEIRDSQFVLMVSTETYLKRVMKEDSGKGLGVMWESSIIYQYLYNAGAVNEKFIPIVFGRENTKHIPIPLQATNYYDVNTKEGYEALYRRITDQPYTTKPNLGTVKKLAPRERKNITSKVEVSLAKLPSTSPDLFGREKELKALDDAWNNQDINVLSLVAWGGVGKSALINKWLLQMAKDNYRGAERVYGWSFYSQGAAEGRQVSADQFIAAALTWFGDPDSTAGSPWDKGERLAELIKQQRALLILDGLEPLQNPPPVETGKIKDPGLTSLLRELARQNPGLVVISTRLTVDDLKDFIGSTALEIDLEALSKEAGAEYLKYLGVDGTEDERKEATKDFGGHALALTLLGRYLKVVHGGDIRKRKEIPHVMDEQKQGKHARRVMESYEVFLKDKPELDILRLMGLFDRPAEKDALDVLRKESVIEGLTDELQKVKDVEWRYAINNLRDLRLLAEPDSVDPDKLDCHPLLREHFGEQLKQTNSAAWREGNRRLYEYYKSTAKEFPETLQEMAPLFAAILHGCQAGKPQETLDKVYYRRIQRGWKINFCFAQLGAVGADLAALSAFFDPPWDMLVSGLKEIDQGIILNNVGVCLGVLGRMGEAVVPSKISLDMSIAIEDWKNAARSAINLSDIYVLIGELDQALIWAQKSVEMADRSKDTNHRRGARVHLGDTLHQAGHFAESEVAFYDALEIQKRNNPNASFFVSNEEFDYHDFLLSQRKYQKVQQRAEQIMELVNQNLTLLDVARNNLSLGRAHMFQLKRNPNYHIKHSINFLNRGVDGLRQAGQHNQLTRGLLARAEFYRFTGTLDKAQKDLDEAFTIATRGGMGLYLAECHLEHARLYFAKGEKAKAREHWQIAKDSIEKMGYHRRDKEVQELEEQLQ
ncbi:MAG: TIR domain-containing protein [Chloroflexota bacterium]